MSGSRLADIVDTDKLTAETPESIKQIWDKYHEDVTKDKIGAYLGKQEYETFVQRAAESPLFVFPLEKKSSVDGPSGFLTVLLQAQLPAVHFTPLSDYQSLGQRSTSILSVNHYPELAESKGIVLSRGDFASSPTGEKLSLLEGKKLLAMAYLYYLNPGFYKRVWCMNHDPEKFSFDELSEELGLLQNLDHTKSKDE
ncbi:hypothetical protein CYMTET_34530 [Cymbomonas tetramitiformis]|uniref:ATP synthase mitochondrial F1 complex assembly factor 1 n=1 Tax=Cymbomonas tetramitiformis TaxID=36881 RepID=A0AAE0FAV5_9CHLO|nr:hypothetical protein CYMTET_34530 [Cymbomonas tetramitiformis]